MDMNVVIQLIGSVGFPIVMCLMLYNKMDKQDAEHKEEIGKLTESLNNNTVAITKLAEKLER